MTFFILILEMVITQNTTSYSLEDVVSILNGWSDGNTGNKKRLQLEAFFTCGERGIRTPGTISRTHV
ncbi:MAG: hypothetical protein WEC59_12155 [Salibacteraceae bacterium]